MEEGRNSWVRSERLQLVAHNLLIQVKPIREWTTHSVVLLLDSYRMHSSPHSSTPIRSYSHSGRVPRSFSSRAPSSCVSWILSQLIIPPVYLLAHSVTMPYRDDGRVKQGNGLCFSLKFWSRIHWPILCFVVVFVMLRCGAGERTNERTSGATGNGSRLARGCVSIFVLLNTYIRSNGCNPKCQPQIRDWNFRPSFHRLSRLSSVFAFDYYSEDKEGSGSVSKWWINGLKYSWSSSSSTSSSHKQMPNENQ